MQSRSETYVVRDPKILSGEPTIRDTRVPVRSVVVGWRRYGNVAGIILVPETGPVTRLTIRIALLLD